MLRLLCTMALSAAIVLIITDLSSAQGRMMSGTSAFGSGGGMSAFGSSGFGGNRFGSSMGSGGFGSSGFGSSGFGSGGFGSGGFGSSGFGSSFGGSGFGSGGMSGFGSQGMGAMGGGGMGGQNFIGRDSADMNAVMNQMGRAGTQFFNTMNRNMGGRNRNRQQQTEQTEADERPKMRIRLEVGFTAPRAAPSALAATMQRRLASLAVDHSLGQPQVVVEGDTVVLRGVAQSESQKLVLANLIALEPGVRAVRNEMTVAGVPVPVAPIVAPTAEVQPAVN
jgi:BON domain